MSHQAGPRRAKEREMIFNHRFSLDPKAARLDLGSQGHGTTWAGRAPQI